MAQPPIAIVGAGLAGLTLARSLFLQNIPFILYDKSPQLPRKKHAITLYEPTWKALLPLLDIDAQSFRAHVGVDAPLGGQGATSKPTDLRLYRYSLDGLLGNGIDSSFRRWHGLKDVVFAPETERSGIKLKFKNGEEVVHTLVIAADGVHSVVRSLVLPKLRLKILPYVVITGVRKVFLGDSENPLVRLFHREKICTQTLHLKNNIVLRLGIDGVDEGRKIMHIRHTFSRPATGENGSDKLYNPSRSKKEATKIPEEFFEEVAAARGQVHHDDPEVHAAFLAIFDPNSVREDRLLSWLMRAGSPLADLQSLSELERKGIAFIGDSVHAHPILGGSGANEAIKDALQLASYLKGASSQSLDGWHRVRYAEWKVGLQLAEESIGKMHDKQKSVLWSPLQHNVVT